jgi:hypothetical protein
MTEQERVLREHLRALLEGGHAHMTFEDAVADFPRAHMNTNPPHVPYTPWHVLEHLRITQWDILEFIRNPEHVSPDWPEGYWPPSDARADAAIWDRTIASFLVDLQVLREMVTDPSLDLYAPIPHGTGQTILREILLVADHNAYHIGEFAILRQVMQTWGNAAH